MYWHEIKITTVPENTEMITGILMTHGVTGIITEDAYEAARHLLHERNWDYVDESLINVSPGNVDIKFYLPYDFAVDETLEGIKGSFAENGIPGPETLFSVVAVDDENWLENWKKYYKPFKVGKRTVIRPCWEEYTPESGETVFTINPGHVFGTGQHQSTKLCILELERNIEPGHEVLDIGCGSGILSLVSVLLGAGHVTATDVDPQAERIFAENAELNGIPGGRYGVMTGDILEDEGLFEKIAGKKYDIVVSNIIADVIIRLAPLAAVLCGTGGVFIASGIIRERADEVRDTLAANGFGDIRIEFMDEWVMICGVANRD